jgi:hypothetical protein
MQNAPMGVSAAPGMWRVSTAPITTWVGRHFSGAVPRGCRAVMAGGGGKWYDGAIRLSGAGGHGVDGVGVSAAPSPGAVWGKGTTGAAVLSLPRDGAQGPDAQKRTTVISFITVVRLARGLFENKATLSCLVHLVCCQVKVVLVKGEV